LEIEIYIGPVLVTLVYLGVYYGAMTHQLFVKDRIRREHKERGEKYDRYFNTNREQLAADRMVLNSLEHMGPFLALLWLMALFVSPFWATLGGAVYTLTRAAYPFLVGRRIGRDVQRRVVLATFTGYGVLALFLGAVALRAFSVLF
jgi:hypothetical protein